VRLRTAELRIGVCCLALSSLGMHMGYRSYALGGAAVRLLPPTTHHPKCAMGLSPSGPCCGPLCQVPALGFAAVHGAATRAG
jgi:hypothetical protein